MHGKDMRILLATSIPSPLLLPLPRAWASAGHDVHIIFDRREGRFGRQDELLTTNRFEHTYLSDEFVSRATTLKSLIELRQTVRGFDVVVLGGYRTLSAQAILPLPSRDTPPLVLLAERPDHRTKYLKRIARDSLLRTIMPRFQSVWAMSQRGSREYTSLGGTVSCLCPYPSPPNSDLGSKASFSYSRPLRLVVIGQLIPRKRPSTAIQVAQILRNQGLNVDLTFAGTGPLQLPLEEMAQSTPASFLGKLERNDVFGLLQDSDVLLHPAEYDGWGMVVPEAVANGVAVVSTSECDAAAELSAVLPTVFTSDLRATSMASRVIDAASILAGTPDVLLESQVKLQAISGVDRLAERTIGALESLVRSG